MVVSKLRQTINKILNPIGLKIAKIGLKPNHITLIGFILGILTAYFYATQQPLFALATIIISGIMDALDGAVARAAEKVTRFGAVLDAVLDRYVEFFIIIGIALGGYTEWVYAMITLFSSIMVSYTRARAESSGGLKNCAVGLFERQERLLTIIVATLILPLYNKALEVALIVIIILSQITVIQRLHYTWKNTRSLP
ncbi:MAG: archaetidylinositol phosphate synthase [Thermoprotei archaeon]